MRRRRQVSTEAALHVTGYTKECGAGWGAIVGVGGSDEQQWEADGSSALHACHPGYRTTRARAVRRRSTRGTRCSARRCGTAGTGVWKT
eukprot:832188-Prymnesium_polylepis.1